MENSIRERVLFKLQQYIIPDGFSVSFVSFGVKVICIVWGVLHYQSYLQNSVLSDRLRDP